MIVAGLVLMDDCCVEWCGEQVVSGWDLATYSLHTTRYLLEKSGNRG